MIVLGYILLILLAISAQLNVFTDYVSKLDTQLGNLREETWLQLSMCHKDGGLRLMLSILFFLPSKVLLFYMVHLTQPGDLGTQSRTIGKI
jgi:hypothetical protein